MQKIDSLVKMRSFTEKVMAPVYIIIINRKSDDAKVIRSVPW